VLARFARQRLWALVLREGLRKGRRRFRRQVQLEYWFGFLEYRRKVCCESPIEFVEEFGS